MIIGAPQVSDFQTLKKAEVDALILQINTAFEQGVPAKETVSFPAFILAQLLATVQYLSEKQDSKPKSMEDLLGSLDSEATESVEEVEIDQSTVQE